jgi:type III secretory pathway component EscR
MNIRKCVVAKLDNKYQNLNKALGSLEKGVSFYKNFLKQHSSEEINTKFEEEYRIYRDSLVQRFEYSIDLFWKYLKIFLAKRIPEYYSILAGVTMRLKPE